MRKQIIEVQTRSKPRTNLKIKLIVRQFLFSVQPSKSFSKLFRHNFAQKF